MTLPILFWDVDTQHDFMDPGGRLAVPGAQQIVENLRTLTHFAIENDIPILGSADAHEEDDEEFEQFPPHCVAGTEGQRRIPATLPEGSRTVQPDRLDRQIDGLGRGEFPQLIIEKRELDVFSEPVTGRILSSLAPREVIVYGVTTEYCVRCTVLGLRERGYPVTVVSDAVRAVDEDEGRRAISEMREQGAALEATASVLGRIRG